MVDAKPKGPILIEMTDAEQARPDSAPAVTDLPASGATMERVVALGSAGPSRLARWGWSLAAAIVGFVASLAAWDYVTGLLERAPVLGMIATTLLGLFLIVLVLGALKEIAGFSRIRRVDRLQKQAVAVLEVGDLSAARSFVKQLDRFYAGREDAKWGRAELAEKMPEILDADGLILLAERSLMGPLDAAARIEIEAAARQVATITAVVPLALADVAVALSANLRMIRRIAEVYGGRAGMFGSWRLVRIVFAHLVATGAVAVGDDLIGSIAGGGVLSKLSRRFGEGVINGALTARVGIAAIEVCRPLPFTALPKPGVSGLVKRALTGLFGQATPPAP